VDKKIKELIEDLEKIENKLIENINLESDPSLNERLIELISEFPDQKQLIKFIIFINDNISNTQIKYRDAIIDSLTNLIEQKKKLLKIIEELHTQKKDNKSNDFKKHLEFLKNLPTVGWIAISATLISLLLFIFLMFHPEKTESITNAVIKISKNQHKDIQKYINKKGIK
jgi:hypothetical protein